MPGLKTIQSRCLLTQYRPILHNAQWERMAQTTNFKCPQEVKHKRPKAVQKSWETRTTWWIWKLQTSAYLITILYQETRITHMRNSRLTVIALRSSESTKRRILKLQRLLLISLLLRAKHRLVWYSVIIRNKVSTQHLLRKWSWRIKL